MTNILLHFNAGDSVYLMYPNYSTQYAQYANAVETEIEKVYKTNHVTLALKSRKGERFRQDGTNTNEGWNASYIVKKTPELAKKVDAVKERHLAAKKLQAYFKTLEKMDPIVVVKTIENAFATVDLVEQNNDK